MSLTEAQIVQIAKDVTEAALAEQLQNADTEPMSAFDLGKLTEQVSNNTAALTRLESKIDKLDSKIDAKFNHVVFLGLVLAFMSIGATVLSGFLI